MLRTASPITIAALLALGACSGEDKTKTAATDTPAADLTPEAGINVAALWGGGKPMPLTMQVKHPNGVILQPLAIQAKPTETVVRIRVINGSDREISLAWRDTYLLAGTERFAISTPLDNPKLKVQPSQSVEGDFVYLGRIPEVAEVRLVFNQGMSGDSEYTREPSMVVPIPMASAAFSNDGSKKN